MALGDKVPEAKVEELIASQRPGQCGSLIYTSGTTGNPKVCNPEPPGTWLNHQPIFDIRRKYDNQCTLCIRRS